MFLFDRLFVAVDQLDLNLVALNAGGVGRDFKPRIVPPGSVAYVEPPGVPRAGDGSLLVELSGSERGSHVRTQVVDSEVFAANVENGDQLLADGKGAPLPFRDSPHLGDGNEIGHQHYYERGSRYRSKILDNSRAWKFAVQRTSIADFRSRLQAPSSIPCF
jgi:hypothetical protein